MTIGNSDPVGNSGLSDAQLRAEASSPETQPQRLFELASTRPDLHPVIAANPNLYPDLRDWLASLGNPEVDAVLAGRVQSSDPQPTTVTRTTLLGQLDGDAQPPAAYPPQTPAVHYPSRVDRAAMPDAAPAASAPSFPTPAMAAGVPAGVAARTSTATSDASKKIALAIGVVAILVIVFIAAFMVARSRDGDSSVASGTPDTSAQSPSTESQNKQWTESEEEPEPKIQYRETVRDPEDVWDEMGFAYMMQGFSGYYANVGSMSEHTSEPFTADVIRAYNDSGANGGSIDLSIYSEAAGRVVDLTCIPVWDGMVNCYGGRSVDLYLFK